ncbi:MAG TPA: hypothetical protein VGC89_05320 [Pyrinomonadaceae bacterium]
MKALRSALAVSLIAGREESAGNHTDEPESRLRSDSSTSDIGRAGLCALLSCDGVKAHLQIGTGAAGLRSG